MQRRTFLAGCAAGTFAVALNWPVSVHAAGDDPLLDQFRDPPPEARPQTWWHWMNGNVTADGITRDLEALAKVGVGGVQMFNVGCGIPAGPAAPLSDEWVKLVRHAAEECGRLGLSFTVHNCPGWSSSGGPWITPELSMQQLVWSEVTLEGGQIIDRVLPKPLTLLNHYRDSLVVAFPSLPGERSAARGQIVHAKVNGSGVDVRMLTDPDAETAIDIKPDKDAPAQLLIECADAYTARSLTIRARPPGDAPNFLLQSFLVLQASDDGTDYRQIARTAVPNWRLHTIPPIIFSFPETSARFFRVSIPSELSISEIFLSREERTADFGTKAGWGRRPDMGETPSETGAIPTIDPASVIDISGFVDRDGRLRWHAPAGSWTVLRFGHTSTGARNVAAPDGGAGLECDKFSPAALGFHFNRYLEQLLPSLEKLGKRSLAGALIDSYETGMQNWTADFPREFQVRRGYAILPYMPALTGRVVGTSEITERFLWDLRRVQAMLMEDHYYGRFDALCREHGLTSYTEPYGNGPFDDLQAGAKVDALMGEFWVRGGAAAYTVKVAATTAHVHGKRFIGAESFTGRPAQSRWLEHPYAMKALGDEMYSLGLNHFVFHRYAQQPHPTARPGMTMGPWGFHFDRTNTWFDQARPWLTYAARCQDLLSQGNFVADILYLVAENSPAQTPVHVEEPVAATLSGPRPKLAEPVPAGHDYDVANADVLLKRVRINNGEIVLPDGLTYRVLVMPKDLRITRELLLKLRELVRAGMWLVGPRVEHSHGLSNYPASDADVRRIAADLWGDLDGRTRTMRRFGNGRVLWGVPLREVLDLARVPPDVEVSAKSPDAITHWIHRRIDDADVYFVANGRRRAEEISCLFRVAGKRPERWDPMTGLTTPITVYEESGDRTRVALRLDESGSCFVVFRKPAGSSSIPSITSADGTCLSTRGYASAASPLASDSFTVTGWIKPETDLWPINPEIASGSERPHIVAARAAALARGGSMAMLGLSGASFVIDPASPNESLGDGAAMLGISAGRNGVILYEHAANSYPAVLAAPVPIAGWTHLAVTYEEGRPTIHLDGRPIAAGGCSSARVHASLHRGITRPRLFEGDIADLHLHPRTLRQNEILQLRKSGLPPPDGPPSFELSTAEPALIMWRNGRYSIGDGFIAAHDIPQPTAIEGPWKISFPPGLGAPPSIVLSRLSSLREHDDFGVRHFSGTATYRTRFEVSANVLRQHRRVFLDLGRAEVIASVLVNGRALGTFWKPPFRLDITSALRGGRNELEVSVTNLWPNRLIGDEHFESDYVYDVTAFDATGGIAELPKWYQEGLPMPTGKRIGFTTWKHYGADDPLVESGLLGPVRLFYAQVEPLPT